MKKTGIILFVIVLLLGCQKSMDADFEIFVKEIKSEYGIDFVEKNNGGFWVIELLEKEQPLDFKKAFEYVVFKSRKLNEQNDNLKSAIEFYSNHKFIFSDEKKHAVDSVLTFSLIQVLKKEVENEEISSDEQFSQINNRLEEIPPYFSKAKALIKNPSKEKLELAIHQYSKDYFFLKNELSLLIRKPDILKEDQIDFSQKNEAAQLAIKDFVAFLNSHLFEIGDRELY